LKRVACTLVLACAQPRAPAADHAEFVIVVQGNRVDVTAHLPKGDERYSRVLAEPVATLEDVLDHAHDLRRFYLRGAGFTTALVREGEAFVGTSADLEAPFVIAPVRKLTVAGATLELAFVPGQRASTDDEIAHWVESSLRAVAGYYARAPFGRAVVTVHDHDDDEIFGLADHHGEGSIALMFGPESRVDGDDDWVATHELLHLAFPFVGRKHAWMSEGMATYVEAVARVRAGQLDEVTMWRDFRRMMPKGQPIAGDEGLERTHVWGRVYWGGALFFLVADVELRTRGNKGLEHALRALGPAPASVADVVRAADAATATTVFAELYAKYALRAEAVDLDKLFARLGAGETLDDHAELAHVRRAIATRVE
jgi:hypothetical protein